MKVTVNFDEFNKIFDTVKLALNQKSIKEENRKVTLIANKDTQELTLAAYTVTTTIRGDMGAEIDNDNEILNLKSIELGNILGVFQGMSKTKATEIDLESLDRGRVRVTVHEEALEEDNDDLNNSSTFIIMNQMLAQQQVDFITQKSVPEEEMVNLDINELIFAVNTLIKQMTSDINNKNNVIFFDKNYAFVSAEGLSVVRNGNGEKDGVEVLHEIGMNYNQISVIQGMLSADSEELMFNRKDRQLYFKNSLYEVFLQNNRFDKRAIKMNVVGSPLDSSEEEDGSDESKVFDGFMVNRPYFQDILKRAELGSPSVSLEVLDEEILEIKGSVGDFEQQILLDNERNSSGICFTLPINVLKSCILTNNLLATEQLFVYFADTRKPNQKKVFLMDDTDSWMSIMVVPVKRRNSRAESEDR